MNIKRYGDLSGVVVHQCLTCGVWLDGDNAAKFFLLFEAGRLTELEERTNRTLTEDLQARVAKLERLAAMPSAATTLDQDCAISSNGTTLLAFDLLGFLRSLF
jgi:hypothetical protein